MRTVDRRSESDEIGGQLVASYLAPPQLGPVTIARPRLVELLRPNAATPVTIVSGEPASGKTSLLVQCLASDEVGHRTHVWLTVPPETDDEIKFWEYLVGAIASTGTDTVRVDDLRAALRDRQRPTDDWLTALANRLSGPDSHFAIVIDDLHELKAPGAMASLARLLEITSGDVSVLVASRVTPDWPLAEWRMSGRLTEITSQDLAITVEETAALLAASGIDVSDEDVVRLVDRTEGWLGGVKLATLAIQRRSDPSDLIARFSATDELVSSYLLRAVLDHLDDEVRRFLHDVSVLETMSAVLCDEIRQADDSDELLERCRAASLFISRVGGATGNYRLHALVRELLLADLELGSRDRFVTLHGRASRALEGAGDIERAIRHAIAAGDDARANSLVIRHTPEIAHQTRFDELRRWAGLITRSGANESGTTTLALAATLAFAGEGTEALRLLDELEAVPSAETWLPLSVQLRAASHMVRGDVHLLRDIGERVDHDTRHLPPDQRGPSVGSAAFVQGVGAFMEGALDDAAELLAFADRPENRPAPPAYIAVKSWAALVALRRGDATGAERCVHAAAERRDELASGDSAAFAPALLTSAELAWERNRLDESAALFTRARRSIPPMPWQAVLVECARSRLTVSRGEPSEALRDLAEIGKLVLSTEGSPLLRALVAERAADICLRMGDVEDALGWAHTYEQCRAGALPWAIRIRLARASDSIGSDQVIVEALAASEPLPCRVDTLLVAADLTNDECVARSHVAEALGLAEPGRLIRRFLDAGPRVASLVKELASDPRRSGGGDFSRFFAAEVADASATASARPVGKVPVVDELVDQLSAREVEVLRLLDQGMSYTEIGSELFVSRNTVKSHVQHIYTKLGTSGRVPAVEMGRRLGLIT